MKIDLRQVYGEIQARLDLVDFSQLWPEFEQKEFAIYDDDFVYFSDHEIPKDNRFLANTAIDFEGRKIAIWGIRPQDLEDLDDLTANIIHESFHVYQQEEGESRFPNELEMLDMTDDFYYFQLKNYEVELLLQAYQEESNRQSLLEAYCRSKKYRLERYPDLIGNELKVETIEGMAEYIGLKALKQLAPDKYKRKLDSYYKILADKTYLFDVRRLGYFLGALQLILLNQAGIDFIHSVAGTAETVFEWAAKEVDAELPTILEDASLNQRTKDQLTIKERAIQSFLEKETVRREVEGRIIGFDPMNMIKIGRLILCNHFIKLRLDSEELLIQGPLLVETKEGSVYEITAYTEVKEKHLI